MLNIVRNRIRGWRSPAAALLGVVLLVNLLGAGQAQAAVRAFTVRYTANTNGNIAQTGNTVMQCSGTCGAVNNSSNMVNVDVDSDAATFNSSSADLSLPGGANILYAGLYWGARSPSAARNQVLFGTPGQFGYTLVTASNVDFTGATGAAQNGDDYGASANVTSLVQAAGNGTYWAANIQAIAPCASGCWGGWSLVVVYADTTQALRNLTVFDGYQYVNNATGTTMGIGGFLTPLSGPMFTRIGLVGWDGDNGAGGGVYTGDQFLVNGTALSDACNPVNDFFNSSICSMGVSTTNRNPVITNTQGVDIDQVNVPAGIVLNGDTSATLKFTTGGEYFYAHVATFVTDLYVPIVVPNVVKTVADVNGGDLMVGDVMRYTISLGNTGQDTATNVILSDNIPAWTTYVPNSLNILTGANAGSKSDSSGNDQAEYIASGTPRVVYRLGAGADGTSGGTLPFGSFTSLSFDVTVNAGIPSGTILTNAADIGYSGQTLPQSFTTTSAIVAAVVVTPPTMSKNYETNPVAVNGVTRLDIVITNPGNNANTLTGITFNDTYPSGLVNSAAPNPAISCTPGATAGTLTGGAAGGNSIGMNPGATLPPNSSCTISVNITSSLAGTYTNTVTDLTSSNGGTSPAVSGTLSVGKPSISKSFAASSVVAGSPVNLTLTLTNPTAAALTGMAFTDTYPGGLVNAATPNASTTCGGAVTATAGSGSVALSGGSVAAGGNCTVSVDVSSASAGVYSNVSGGVSSTETGAAGLDSAPASVTVIGPPIASKVFQPPSVVLNNLSALRITINNPNTTTTLTGVAFTDTYPANLVNNAAANSTLNCTSGSSATKVGGVAAGNTLGISGGTLAPGGSCTLTVNVSSGTVGNYLNSTGTVSSNEGGNGTAASATLNVNNNVAPTATKVFSPATIQPNGTSTLTLTFNNSNALAVTGLAFIDSYPVRLFNAATPALTNSCGGTATAVAGGSSLALSGGTIPATGSCVVTVAVTSSVADGYNNTLPAGSITTANAGVIATDVSGQVQVLAAPAITKSFNATSVAVNGTSTLTIVLTNPSINAVALTGVAFSDTYPLDLVNNAITVTKSCTAGGTTGTTAASATATNPGTLTLTGGTIAARGSCTYSVVVKSAIAGGYTNTTGAVSSTNGGTGLTASATLSVARPAISKAFAPAAVNTGANSTLTITLSNPTAVAMTLAAFTDTYPAGIVNANTPTTTCASGTASGTPGGASVGLSGGTIPAAGTCTVTVTVTATGTATNTIAAGALTVSGGASNPVAATATLTVNPAPIVSKNFAPASILTGGTSTLSVIVQNPNSSNMTGVSFTDSYPANMVNAATPAVTASPATCTGTLTGTAGAAAFSLSGGTVPGNSACTYTVNVTSNTAGTYVNSTGAVTSVNFGTGTAGNGTLSVMGPPVASKSFTPVSIAANSTSVLLITLTNPNSVAITGTAFTDAYPAGMVNSASASPSTSCAGATVTAANGGNSLSMISGAIPANSSCNVTVNVTSATGGVYVNNTGSIITNNAGNGTSAQATLTVSVVNVSGFVFSDSNSNGGRDTGESWSGGTTVYAKLFSGACPVAGGSTAAAVQTINAGGGSYQFSNVGAGSYCIVLSSNSTATVTTPSTPSGWVNTLPNPGQINVTASTVDVPNQNFGLYNGASLSGRIFADTGAGGGTANNGIQDGAEAGIGSVTVVLNNTSCAGGICGSAVTDASGNFSIAIPLVASGSCTLVETNPTGHSSTGGSAGTSGGSYSIASDTTTFSCSPGTSYSGLNFADVPVNRFLTDGVQTSVAGSVLWYSHIYTAGTAGSVSFGSTGAASPAAPAWSEVLYQDSNCNAAYDAAEPALVSAQPVVAGQVLCILVKEFVPAAAPLGAQNHLTVSATFTASFTGIVDVLTRSDVTTVGLFSGAGLTLNKTVDKATAKPGDALVYTIAYTNSSSGALSNVIINDMTPSYTQFLSAGCGVLPANLTGCATTLPGVGGTGAITYTFSGTLAPAAGSSVTFTVQVQP